MEIGEINPGKTQRITNDESDRKWEFYPQNNSGKDYVVKQCIEVVDNVSVQVQVRQERR